MVWIYIRRHVESGRVETSRTESRQDAKCWANGQRSQQLWPRRTLARDNESEIGGSRLTLDELSPDSPLSVTTARSRERARGQHSGRSATDTVDDHQMAGGRALSFSHYTTEGIFIHGDPAFLPSLEPPRPRAAAPRRRRARLEWEFSLTISGNSQIIA